MPSIENGSHRKEGGMNFEWWYLNFLSQDGRKINVVLHETDIFGLEHKVFYSMTIKDRWESRYFKNANLESAFDSGEFLYLDGIAEEDSGIIKLDLDFGGIGLHGEIIKLVPPVAINNATLYQEGEKRSFWLVQVPRGAFEADLVTEFGSETLRGFAYHDHQWGDIRIQDFVSDWVWGNFGNDYASLVFFKIKTQQGRYINRFILVEEGEVEFGEGQIQADYFESLAGQLDIRNVELNALVALPNDEYFRFALSSNKIMRARLNESVEQLMASYIRWSADGNLEEGDRIQGITEYLRIRRVNE